MSQLSRDLKKSRKAAYATGTIARTIELNVCFTLHFNSVFLPASLHTICFYCQFLSWSMTPPSVRNYLSGVKLLHLMLGFEFPHLSSHKLKLVKHRPHRAPLITPTLLRTLVACGVDFDPVDLTFSCAFSFAFFLFARISNLVPESFVTSGVQEHRCICHGDVAPTHYGLCVQLTWSKTMQLGE